MADTERWKNVTTGTRWFMLQDQFGRPVDKVIRPGQTVEVDPEVRRMNSDAAAGPDLDIFRNGDLQPVRLIEGHEDVAAVTANPNTRGEAELEAMFGLHWKKFEAEVSAITNLTLLNRLLDIATEQNSTVRQVEVIKARIAEVNPVRVAETQLVAPQPGDSPSALNLLPQQ